MLGDLLGELARKAVAALERSRVNYAVCGGVAIALSGRGRSTRDLDVLAVMSDQAVVEFIAAAREEGFSHHDRADRHKLDDVVLYRFWLPIGDTDLSTSLDLQVACTEYHRQAVERARAIGLAGQTVKVVAPEDLVLTKLLAFRPIDRADAIDVVVLNELDYEYLQEWASRLGLGERLDEVIQTARAFSTDK